MWNRILITAIVSVSLLANAQPAGDSKPAEPAATEAPATETPATETPATETSLPTPTVPVPTTTTPATNATPVQLRLRRLEQGAQSLKERAFRNKATVAMLKERVVGGGVGAQLHLFHRNEMGSSFRLVRLAYALDGAQIFSRTEKSSPNLYKVKDFDVLTGPVNPGTHTVNVVAVYRGHGYGVFKTLETFTFTVRSTHTFTVAEGKIAKVEAIAYEKGNSLTKKMKDRPGVRFKVVQQEPDNVRKSQPKAATPEAPAVEKPAAPKKTTK